MRFQKLSAQYEAEQDEIQKLAAALENEIENESGQIKKLKISFYFLMNLRGSCGIFHKF